MKPSPKVHLGYFQFFFKSVPYIGALQRTADFIRDGQDLNFSNFRQVPLPEIALDEQRAIAEYLSSATASANAAIDRATREAHLIREYRDQMVADVLTGRLDVRAAAATLPDDVANGVEALADKEVADDEAEVDTVEEAADVAQ